MILIKEKRNNTKDNKSLISRQEVNDLAFSFIKSKIYKKIFLSIFQQTDTLYIGTKSVLSL